jgi:alkanesulfonate monooxygenase SsuD/methylene tetrahydromethanopterin reductase-like flavin-dependent oxidoreductase (luciferase family)
LHSKRLVACFGASVGVDHVAKKEAGHVDMMFGIFPPVVAGVCVDPTWMTGFAVHADQSGFESLVVVEHTVVVSDTKSTYPYARSGRMPLADDCPIPDPLDLLSFLAAKTQRIVLATGVLIISNHHPVDLAKRVATLDCLSEGRVRLCVGIGWMQEEIEACGVDFSTRGRRADEAIDVMRTLWAQSGPEGASFDGEFFTRIRFPSPFAAACRFTSGATAPPLLAGRGAGVTVCNRSASTPVSSPTRPRSCGAARKRLDVIRTP